ncbi:MAG: sulfatase maturation enzyme AslB (radical SAM superfamily) [Kiritimatiellia bacterium]|jgi:sulfatase maturation enzyme AslB (radical SAM superfamily)
MELEKMHHLDREDWLLTQAGDLRGYIDARRLRELWFHTGTTCNLRCPFCLEGSKPGDNRINAMLFDDARPFIDEALTMGVEQFSFTGGEPFIIPDFIRILEYALEHRPCLVLTNGTEPLLNRLADVLPLKDKPHPLKFRISLDYPDAAKHNQGRGPGTFDRSLDCLGRLHAYGFDISIARQRAKEEDVAAMDVAFHPFLESVGVPTDINIVSFPDFLTPGETADVPEITENCMTQYQTAETRDAYMCADTRFVLKKDGRMRVYACTLVDDDIDYDLGSTLKESMEVRVMLKHHRCFSCFAYGASCSEK